MSKPFTERIKIKTITLIRHGESKEQSGEVNDGMNPELSQLGIRQSERLRKRLQNQLFDLALVSPLDRAFKTFEIASPQTKNAELDSRLIEIDYVENWYKPMAGYSPNPTFKSRNNSSWLNPIKNRTEEFVDELVSLDYKDIVVFGHQGIFKHLIAQWLEIPVKNIIHNLILDNTCLTGLALDESSNKIVEYINDSHHLKEI